jgi:hypothetical protein
MQRLRSENQKLSLQLSLRSRGNTADIETQSSALPGTPGAA